MHTTILETERLLLRPFRETDLQELFECCQNPNLGNNAGWEPHKSIEDPKRSYILYLWEMKEFLP